MLITTTNANVVGPTLGFTIVVPGDQRWSLQAVRAIALTQAGGQPNRAYTLGITDGTNTVGVVGAADVGTEPAVVSITWTQVQSAAVAAGSVGIVVAPLPAMILNPGYTIQGAIVASAAGDTWDTAIAWYSYVQTG